MKNHHTFKFRISENTQALIDAYSSSKLFAMSISFFMLQAAGGGGISLLQLLFILVAVLIMFRLGRAASTQTNLSHWHHHFENLQYSPQEFYQLIRANILEKQIPGLRLSHITYSEGVFIGRREYMRVSRKHLVFDICAAPFANSFYVSWWFGETKNLVRMMVRAIPFIGEAWEKGLYEKTFYQLDAEQLYRSLIQQSVMDAVDTITTAKGVRMLSDLERRGSTLIPA